MNVRVKMNQLTERLNGTDHAGHGVGPTAGGAIDGDPRERRRTAQVAQQPAVKAEADAQPLRDREHELPVRHLGADMLGHPAGLLQRPAMAELTVLPISVRIVNMFVSYGEYLAQPVWPKDLAVVYP